MKLIFTLFTAFLFSFPSFSQVEHQWSFSIGSKESDFVDNSVVDHAGNIYIMLEVYDTVDIDPGAGVKMIVPEDGMSSILTKYDQYGNLIYGNPFYLDAEEGYIAIVEARHNQLKLNAYFADSLVYVRNGVRQKLYDQPGYHVALLTTDLDGKIIKSHFVRNPPDFFINEMYTFPDGQMLISGSFADTLTFHSQSPIKLISTGGRDAYMMLIDSDYRPVWYQQFEGTGYDFINNFTVGDDEKIYFSGGFTDTVTIHTIKGTIEFISIDGYEGLFGYMSMSGTIENIFALQGPDYEDITNIQPDIDGSMFISGQYAETVNFAGLSQPPQYKTALGDSEGYVAHYDKNGNLIWLRLYQGTTYVGIHNLELKRGNELYLSGTFWKRADLNPGPDSLIAVNANTSAPFISKLNTNGEFLWSIPMVTNHQAGIRSIHVLTEESRIIISGYHTRSIHLGIVPGEHVLDTEYGADCFFASYSEENVITANHDDINIRSWENMELFPNPATDNITIRTESDLDNLSLYNASGTLIYEVHSIQSNQVEMKLSGLPSGLYYITTTSEDKLLTGKFIKE